LWGLEYSGRIKEIEMIPFFKTNTLRSNINDRMNSPIDFVRSLLLTTSERVTETVSEIKIEVGSNPDGDPYSSNLNLVLEIFTLYFLPSIEIEQSYPDNQSIRLEIKSKTGVNELADKVDESGKIYEETVEKVGGVVVSYAIVLNGDDIQQLLTDLIDQGLIKSRPSEAWPQDIFLFSIVSHLGDYEQESSFTIQWE
jgi:hypothetical protein